MSLDVPAPQFKQWIEQAAELLIAHCEKQSEAPVFAGKSPRQVKALFDEPLPGKPRDIAEVLQAVGHDVLASITNSAGPRYFGYITGGGNQAAVLKTYGAARLREAIRADIRKVQYVCELVNESDNMEIMAHAPLSIVCFRFNPGGIKEEAINALNDSIIEKAEQELSKIKCPGHFPLFLRNRQFSVHFKEFYKHPYGLFF